MNYDMCRRTICVGETINNTHAECWQNKWMKGKYWNCAMNNAILISERLLAPEQCAEMYRTV